MKRGGKPSISPGSFVWIASEPENIIAMYAGGRDPLRLHSLLERGQHLRRVK